MVSRTIYVETSIPSFYYESRSEPEMQARCQWTRRWWTHAGERYQLFTSEAVLDELGRGSYPSQADCLALMRNIPILTLEPAVADIVGAYIRHKLMPADPGGDALHLALASYHKCDFLLTWNCQHLANANKFGHIRRVNTRLGLYSPELVTPLEFQAESGEDVL